MSELESLIQTTRDRVTAVEIDGKTGQMLLFLRAADGSVVTETRPFQPYMLLHNEYLLQGCGVEYHCEVLTGHHNFQTIAFFNRPEDYDVAKTFLKLMTGYSAGSPNAPYIASTDLVQQALIQNKIRLFSGMTFNDVCRMQVDIETLCEPGFDFSNADREGDAICIIGMRDSTGREKALSLRDGTEKEMLEDFVKTVQEWDPDIIEGHNFFRFDLPYLEARAKRHKVSLNLGRDGSTPRKRNSRFNIAERTVNYTRYDIFGRHIIDTYHLTLFYDAVSRELDSYGLKAVARHFGVAAKDRTYLCLGEEASMDECWKADPQRSIDYCLDDVRETEAISAILSPSFFYQTQILPYSYQNCVIRGNATKIDAMFLAEYITQRHSIPVPQPAVMFSGALSRSLGEGVFHNVFHCDVRSLYPSILLVRNESPVNDTLGIFLKYLNTLRTFRLQMKDRAKGATTLEERNYASNMQKTFKILINSFYGYLGFAQGFLNDYALAEQVTSRGREILTSMLEFLTKSGAEAIEMDTDGIYFHIPGETVTAEELERNISDFLPRGIQVDFDDEYPAMFAYKAKNYALLHKNGEITLAGAALKSRGLEPFQRDYIYGTISAILHNDAAAFRKLDADTANALKTHAYPFAKLAKSETLTESPANYLKKNTRRSAAYELAAKSGKKYNAGDKVSFYITGEKKNVAVVDAAKLLSEAKNDIRDENVAYYLSKLDELRKKFSPFTESFTADVVQDTLF